MYKESPAYIPSPPTLRMAATSASLRQIVDLLDSYAGLLAEARVFEHLLPYVRVVRSLEKERCDGVLIVDAIEYDPTWPADSHQQAEREFFGFTNPDRAKQLQGLFFDIKMVDKTVVERNIAWNIESLPNKREAVDFYIICFNRLPNMCAIVPKVYLFPEEREVSNMDKESPNQNYGESWERHNPRIRIPLSIADSNLAENVPPPFLPFLVPVSILFDVLDDIRQAAHTNKPFKNRFTKVEYSRWALESKPLISAIPSTQVSSYARINEFRIELQHPSSPIHMEMMMCRPLLCDFKLLLKNLKEQYFIEHEHSLWKGTASQVSHVMCRDLRYLFHPDVKWDYFWTDGGVAQETQFFFIPRYMIPVHWWANVSNLGAFEMQSRALGDFFIDRKDGNWLMKVATIIRKYGKATWSPPCDDLPTLDRKIKELATTGNPEDVDEDDDDNDNVVVAKAQNTGRNVFSYKSLSPVFNHLNRRCALEKRGLFVFAGERNSCGDFFFVDYQWSPLDQETFYKYGWPPTTLERALLSPYQPCLWIKIGVTKKSDMLESKLECPEVMTLYSGHANFPLLRDINEDMRNSECNFYLIPSIMLNKDLNAFHHRPHRESHGVADQLHLEIDTDEIDPRPFLRIDGESLITFLLDVLSLDEHKMISPFWLSLKASAGMYREKFLSNILQGTQAMADELWKWG